MRGSDDPHPGAPEKRNFGSIRQLASGRYQARYTAPGGSTIKAPTTFASRRQADQWLATEHADLTRGTWRDAAAGGESLSDHVVSWLDPHPDIRPRTRELDASLANRFIIEPPPQLGAEWLGARPVGQITPANVRLWHSWVLVESRRGSLARRPPARKVPGGMVSFGPGPGAKDSTSRQLDASPTLFGSTGNSAAARSSLSRVATWAGRERHRRLRHTGCCTPSWRAPLVRGSCARIRASSRAQAPTRRRNAILRRRKRWTPSSRPLLTATGSPSSSVLGWPARR
ncbi:hypothetical protein FBY41_1082 [Humibacillus xanthopallidus]|uniref:Phage L5-like integrase N-terminal domain-containing protein n=1 Tax=Humibacillus xanthopallidus TaxID=412689 RepID=A0A543I282_9MICO|nr:hypothetical protein FBY41_1082 [Humibacillus xanthopallidus]